MKTEPFQRPPGKHIPVPFWLGVILKFILFLLIPAAATVVLSMSRLTLTRTGGTVTAEVNRMVFFAIPWRTQTLTGVQKANFTKIEGDWIRRKPGDTRRQRREMDNGVLTLTGTDGELRIETDPATGREKHDAVAAFLADPKASTHRQFLMGNRLFGYLFGIPATLLAALYVVGCTLALSHKLFGFPKKPKPFRGGA